MSFQLPVDPCQTCIFVMERGWIITLDTAIKAERGVYQLDCGVPILDVPLLLRLVIERFAVHGLASSGGFREQNVHYGGAAACRSLGHYDKLGVDLGCNVHLAVSLRGLGEAGCGEGKQKREGAEHVECVDGWDCLLKVVQAVREGASVYLHVRR